MKKYFFCLLVICLMSACTRKDKLPEGILSKTKMQAVMWDMVRAGEFLNGYVLNMDTLINKSDESQKWYDKIYKLHKTTKAEFDKSYTYYEQKPVLMKEILDSLSRKQVATRTNGQAPSSTNVDTAKKKSLFPSIDTRIKTGDSLNRRRILKRDPKAQ